jgi:hypothetical protein
MVKSIRNSKVAVFAKSYAKFGTFESIYYTRTLELLTVFSISVFLFLPILYHAIHYHPLIGTTDYETHNLIAQHMREGVVILLPHFLYHTLVISTSIGFSVSISIASLMVVLLSFAAVPTLLLVWLPARRHSLLIAMCATLAAPITILTLALNKMYFGYIPLALYHSPTMVLMKPLALLHFYFASRSLLRQQLRATDYVRDILLLILVTLAKPSYTLCLVPAAIVFICMEKFFRRPASLQYLVFGIVLPSAILLMWQYFFFFVAGVSDPMVQVTSIEFRPFAAVLCVAGHGPQWFVLASVAGRLVMSIAFPLTVLVAFRSKLQHRSEYWFAFWLFAFGNAYFYLLAETGRNIFNLNFLWGASISLFIWFVASLRVWMGERASLNPKAIKLCTTVLILHITCGIIWYIAQSRSSWFDSW